MFACHFENTVAVTGYWVPCLDSCHISGPSFFANITGLSTPFNLRLESGASLKTNFRHSLEIDSRDDRILPQSGVLLRLSEELAFINPPPPRTAVGLETSAP